MDFCGTDRIAVIRDTTPMKCLKVTQFFNQLKLSKLPEKRFDSFFFCFAESKRQWQSSNGSWIGGHDGHSKSNKINYICCGKTPMAGCHLLLHIHVVVVRKCYRIDVVDAWTRKAPINSLIIGIHYANEWNDTRRTLQLHQQKIGKQKKQKSVAIKTK